MTKPNVIPLEQSAAPAPPHNPEIEAALLGALLTNNRVFEKVSEILEPEHFYEPVHGRIYEVAGALVDRGETASPLTLARHFETDAGLADVGGGQYVYDLAAAVVSVVNVADYARTIADLATKRAIIDICRTTEHAAYADSIEAGADAVLEHHEAALQRLEAHGSEATAISLGAATDAALATVDAARRHDGEVSGIPTGLAALDRITAGLHAPDVVILAGRPAMGKSALAGTIGYNVANGGRRVLLYSLEMSAPQIAHRLISAAAGVPSEDMRRGRATDLDMTTLQAARDRLAELPLTIDDDGRMTVAKLRSRARRRQRRHGLDLVIVDYIQKLRASDEMRRRYSNVADMTEISGDLKSLAKELGVPILVLSQLSRAVEQRDDKRPMLSDLRESGAIEQDADVVIFIYRDEYYAKKAEPLRGSYKSDTQFDEAHIRWGERWKAAKGVAEAIIAKQRMGPTGDIKLRFDGSTMSFGDLDGGPEYPL